MVRDEQRLLVGLVPHHKVQRGGALTERRHVGQQEDRRGERERGREAACSGQAALQGALRRTELLGLSHLEAK